MCQLHMQGKQSPGSALCSGRIISLRAEVSVLGNKQISKGIIESSCPAEKLVKPRFSKEKYFLSPPSQVPRKQTAYQLTTSPRRILPSCLCPQGSAASEEERNIDAQELQHKNNLGKGLCFSLKLGISHYTDLSFLPNLPFSFFLIIPDKSKEL